MASKMASKESSNIILDGRPFYEYEKEHIDGSFSLSIPGILARRIASKPEKIIEMISDTNLNIRIKNLKENNTEKILYLINEHFSDILKTSLVQYYGDRIIFINYNEYKEENKDKIKLVLTEIKNFVPFIQSTPPTPDCRYEISEIIPGLFLGGEETAKNKNKLKELGITTIINMTEEISNFFVSDFTYYRFPLSDKPNCDIKNYFEDTYKIISYVLENKQKILIHCYAGISRSATIVIAYIMKKNNMCMNDSLHFVQQKRSCISPNFGFCSQLILYEKEQK